MAPSVHFPCWLWRDEDNSEHRTVEQPRSAQHDETGHGSHGIHPHGEAHSGAAHWEHLVHYAHEAHLAAEAIESASSRCCHENSSVDRRA